MSEGSRATQTCCVHQGCVNLSSTVSLCTVLLSELLQVVTARPLPSRLF